MAFCMNTFLKYFVFLFLNTCTLQHVAGMSENVQLLQTKSDFFQKHGSEISTRRLGSFKTSDWLYTVLKYNLKYTLSELT